jgi:hypothetical protein
MAEPMKSLPARQSGFRLSGILVALGVSFALLLIFHFLTHPHP